jgi:glutathione synthase
MAAGGLAEARPLSVAARRIAEDIAPTLLAAGIIFAGLDVLGEHLTEINITCPTGLREVRDQTGDDLAEDVLDTVRAVLVPA